MKDWQIDMAVREIEFPDFENKLNKEVALMKFKAVIAVQILQTAEDFGVAPKELYEDIGDWLSSLIE